MRVRVCSTCDTVLEVLLPFSDMRKHTVLPTPAFKRILGVVTCESCTEINLIKLRHYKTHSLMALLLIPLPLNSVEVAVKRVLVNHVDP